MDPRSNFQRVVLDHARRYPLWQPQDIYKLAYQAAMGSAHAVLNRDNSRARLEMELAGLTAAPPYLDAEPLIDPISEDGGIVRVHLRPFARLGFPVETLLEAFMRTTQEFPGSIETLKLYLAEAAETSENEGLSFSVRQLTGFFHHRAREGFPQVHHSDEYRRAYLPAYRVVAAASLQNINGIFAGV